ncbi:MAG: transglutaminase family protein [Sphingobium sp.]|nr:transglutaminase family protein [Sphingobium sp.]MCP5399041.1 transglutaminase family protein [Sphingomonas sp.]
MKLVVRHQTLYRYESGGSRVAMLLKLMPSDNAGQKIIDWQLTVNDEPVTDFVRNGHGDMESLWVRHDQLDSATIIASGVVETRDNAGVIAGMKFQPDPRVYLRETPLTNASDAMCELADDLDGDTMLARLHNLSQAIRDKVAYRSGATQAETPAAEAYVQGAGVCQDHAQIFIAMARHIGVPSRYVSGYLMADSEEGALHETHAWAESWLDNLGWVGFDVSNGVCVTDHYIRLACGLDAHDAAPVRGTALASGSVTVDADVRIDMLEDDSGESGIVELRQQQQQQ